MNKNQKWLIIILIILVVLFFYFVAKVANKSRLVKKEEKKTTSVVTGNELYSYYSQCEKHLSEIQTLSDGRTVNPPQVYCKLENNGLSLLPTDKINMKPGDNIFVAIDAQRLKII